MVQSSAKHRKFRMFQKITRRGLEAFLKRYATNEVVLDIGGGHVDTNHSYDHYFPNRTTIDIDPKREPDVVGDVHTMPLPDESHSIVLCTEVLEHCHTPQLAIDEMERVLKPGGTLILTTRFVYPHHDVPHDYFRYTKFGLSHLLRNWEIETLEYETESFSTIAALLQRICFQTRLRLNRPMKVVLFSIAWILDHCNGLIVKEYGDINRETDVDRLMSTGLFVVAKKKR